METTIDVVDSKLFEYVKSADKYVPNFMRVLAATRFSKNANEWINNFKQLNSGTYSSQWMIIDYNIFKEIRGTDKTPKNLIYVAEQNPKELIHHDISDYVYKVQLFLMIE